MCELDQGTLQVEPALERRQLKIVTIVAFAYQTSFDFDENQHRFKRPKCRECGSQNFEKKYLLEKWKKKKLNGKYQKHFLQIPAATFSVYWPFLNLYCHENQMRFDMWNGRCRDHCMTVSTRTSKSIPLDVIYYKWPLRCSLSDPGPEKLTKCSSCAKQAPTSATYHK